jgi:hypothetical protein
MSRKLKADKTALQAPASPPAVPENEVKQFMYARALLRPSTLAANTIGALKLTADKMDFAALTVALREQIDLVTAKNDLTRAESMLICQAHTLDALFCVLTKRATMNLGEYMSAAESYMRMALRAQSQCRATLETLATIKNPPNPTFIRQANVAHGPQQVNNGTAPADDPSRAREAEKAQNRLLEQQNGERLDTLTACAASGADPAMATLGEGDGPEVPRG